MNTEDSPGVLSVRTGFLPEASAVSGVLDGQIRVLQPLSLMEGRDGLLRGSDEILVRLGLSIIGDLVQLLVKLLELRCLGHGFPQHEEGRLVGLVAFAEQELQAVVDKSEVEEETVASQAVASVADNLDSTLRVVAVYAGEDFVMRHAVLLLNRDSLGHPVSDESVVVLVVADRYRLVDVVANRLGLLQESIVLLTSRVFQLLLLIL